MILSTYCFSQTEAFTTGWYQVLTGAQVKVIQGNSYDTQNKVDWTGINYASSEVLLVFNFSKDIYYCYDPDGRLVLVKGKASLKKIEIPGRPARITQEVKIGLDISLSSGNNVWLTGFNAANKTAQILLQDGSKVDVPQESITDLKDFFDTMNKLTEWKTVE
ncbi:MAG TPA: hypothetical protein DEH02_17560 [Bacteroidales bacterium]|nr:hypothetical protein [Bacteroidales bacterium]